MRVVIQRGHVPRTTGATGAPGEQAFAIDTADRLARHLAAAGFEPHIINADVADSEYRGGVFVAIHYDSSTSPSAHGASVGYQTPEGKVLADAWKKLYQAAGWTRGFRGDNYTAKLAGYYGVKHAVAQGNRRAIIVESGFHSNPEDAALLKAPAGPERVAVSVLRAITSVVGTPHPTPHPPPPPGGTCTVNLRVLRNGMSGGDVTSLQALLNTKAGQGLRVDGKFGDMTERAVRNVQRYVKIHEDGVVGSQTWSVLFL